VPSHISMSVSDALYDACIVGRYMCTVRARLAGRVIMSRGRIRDLLVGIRSWLEVLKH